jgi:hypothetical protein
MSFLRAHLRRFGPESGPEEWPDQFIGSRGSRVAKLKLKEFQGK